MATAPTVQQAAQINAAQRQLVLMKSTNFWQNVYSQTLTGTLLGQVVNIQPRYVGLTKKFWIEVTGTFIQSAAETQTRTQFGPANFLSNITITDTNNVQRIITTGWHLHMVATAKQRGPFGAAYTTDSPVNFGSNFPVIQSYSPVTSAAKTIRMIYEVPMAYSDTNLSGALFTNLVNATMNIQLTVNPNFSVGSGGDPTLACYQSSTAGDLGTLSAVSINVYQNYLYGLPQDSSGNYILPTQDLSTVYYLNSTSVTGMSAGLDFGINYLNYRSFLSTCAIYDNAKVLNAGTDINYWAIAQANSTQYIKFTPEMVALQARTIFGDDPPLGTYYFDHRNAPIQTSQQGNTQLVLNPITVTNSTSVVLLGYESTGSQALVSTGGSLPSG
jgi:hypothetical protein